jgi:hypothetical protein
MVEIFEATGLPINSGLAAVLVRVAEIISENSLNLTFISGLPDFSCSKHTKTGKIYPMATNGRKLYQMEVKYYKWS